MQRSWFLVVALACALAGCSEGSGDGSGDDDGDDDETPAQDAGQDGGRDGGSEMDAARDAGEDSGPRDTGVDARAGDDGGRDGGGDAGGDARADAAPVDAGPESFEAIYNALLSPRCSSSNCHDGQDSAGDLDLSSADDARDALVDEEANGPQCGDMDLTRVVEGNAAASLLIQKLEGTQPCGVRMPAGSGVVALSPDEIARIRRWIDQGAEDN